MDTSFMTRRGNQRMRSTRLLYILIATIGLAGPLQAEETLPKSIYVTPKTVKGWQGEGREITFLDVRETDELEAGHLPGALNIVYTDVSSRNEATEPGSEGTGNDVTQ